MRKSLNRRLTAAEKAVWNTKRADIEIIQISGCLPQPLCYAEGHGRGWRREATESYEQFENRVVSEAHAAGLKNVVIGGLPPDFLDPGTLERFLARCNFPEIPPEEGSYVADTLRRRRD